MSFSIRCVELYKVFPMVTSGSCHPDDFFIHKPKHVVVKLFNMKGLAIDGFIP